MDGSVWHDCFSFFRSGRRRGWAGSLVDGSTNLAARYPPRQKSIRRNLSRTEDQHDERRDQERVRCCARELVRTREDGKQRFAIGRDVGYEHVDDERQRTQTRSEAQNEKHAAPTFDSRDEVGVQRRRRYAQLREEAYNFPDIG